MTMLYQGTTGMENEKKVFNSRAVIRYAERPYTTFSFKLLMKVRMLYGKETAVPVWSCNLPIITCMQL